MATPPASVITIDCHYEGPEKASAYLIIEDGRAAFVDNNTVHAVPHLLRAVTEHGLTPEQVDYAIITHVHLDHAGGSAALLKACPNATLLAHPKAARHMIDPARLIAGSKVVYGEEAFRELYGEIEPVPAERVRTMEDGECLDWGTRTFRLFYTLGHASHHFCIYDSGSNGVFTGDSFGIGRTSHVRPGASFLVCSSTPVEFDGPEAHKAVDQIVATGAAWAYVGHYGSFERLPECARQLHRSIDQHEAILKAALAESGDETALQTFCEPRVRAALEDHLRWVGVEDAEDDLAWIGGDVALNAQGLVAAVVRARRKRAT
ncbi:MAG: MBL fold metallo-hydrolase [Candidatus Hydrogenedentes bacterium]|nr:MBL fold metallo-hydrolase [Candidatus Hydrogenedentota bacterium]